MHESKIMVKLKKKYILSSSYLIDYYLLLVFNNNSIFADRKNVEIQHKLHHNRMFFLICCF